MEKNRGDHKYVASWVKKMAKEKTMGDPLRILEIGCGCGEHFDAWERYGEACGVDDDEKVIALAKERHPRVRFQKSDYCALGFKEEFSLVVSEDTFSHLADQIGLLKSVAEALTLNGVLIVTMGGEGSLACVQRGLIESLSKHSGGYSSQFCFPKEGAYKRVLDIAGLSVVDMQTVKTLIELPGGPVGLQRFIEDNFGGALGVYRPQDRELVIRDIERACRDDLWNERKQVWTADVCSLQFVARKTSKVRGLGGAMQFSILGS